MLKIDLEPGQVFGAVTQAYECPVEPEGPATLAPVESRARVEVVDRGDPGGEVAHVRLDADDTKADPCSPRWWVTVLDCACLGKRIEGHGDDGPDMHPVLLLHGESSEHVVRCSGHAARYQLYRLCRIARQPGDVGVIRGPIRPPVTMSPLS